MDTYLSRHMLIWREFFFIVVGSLVQVRSVQGRKKDAAEQRRILEAYIRGLNAEDVVAMGRGLFISVFLSCVLTSMPTQPSPPSSSRVDNPMDKGPAWRQDTLLVLRLLGGGDASPAGGHAASMQRADIARFKRLLERERTWIMSNAVNGDTSAADVATPSDETIRWVLPRTFTPARGEV